MTNATTDAAEAQTAEYNPTEADALADRLLQSIAFKVYTSDDDVIREAATMLRRLATAEAASRALPVTHRGWNIIQAAIGYDIQHPDYDPENEIDWRHGHADTVEGARAEIDRLLAEDAEWTEAANIVKDGLIWSPTLDGRTRQDRAEARVREAFHDGYQLGFQAAKHPFHMPEEADAWECRGVIKENGHIRPYNRGITDGRA